MFIRTLKRHRKPWENWELLEIIKGREKHHPTPYYELAIKLERSVIAIKRRYMKYKREKRASNGF